MLGSFPHNGVRINFSLMGRGPRVLFLQCPGARGTFWIPQCNALSSSFTCLRCEYPRDDSWRAAVEALLDHLSWTDFHLVGHGFGSYLALDLAHHHPHNIQTLSLLCPTEEPISAKRLLDLASPSEIERFGEAELQTHLTLLCGPQNICPNATLSAKHSESNLPTLLLTTQHQRRQASGFPNATLVNLPHSSHAAPILAAPQVAAALKNHLRQTFS